MNGSQHIASALDRWSRQTADKPGIIIADEGDTLRQCTYRELQRAVKLYTPDVVVCDQRIHIDIDSADSPLTWLISAEIEALFDTGSDQRTPAPSLHDARLRLATSGSTGTPKGVELTAYQCVITAQNIIRSHQLTDQVCCPPYCLAAALSLPQVQHDAFLEVGCSAPAQPRYAQRVNP